MLTYKPNIVLSNKEYKVIGTRPIRQDGAEKVTGRAGYGADVRLPGLLYGNSQPGASWSTFSSRHPGGVQFCFGDGSVRFLRYGATTIRSPKPSADWILLQQLGGIRDGAVTTNTLE